MPFETPSLPVLIKRTQSDLAGDSLRQSDAQVLARTLGGAAYGLYGYLDWIAEQILPDKADESTLERIAALRLNQPRKPAQVATGSVSFTATAGAVLDVDTLLQASDGRTYKVTTARTTVNGSNTTTIAALDAGSLGNADAGLALTPVQPIAGVVGNSFVVLAPGLSGGVARESLESLRSRVIRSYRVIPHGGSASDYETWALEVPGVTRAWCRGGLLGPGTVTVFIMRDEDPQPVPNDEQLAEVQDYIEPLRPVTAEVHVQRPIQVPVVYRFKSVNPDTTAVRAAVEAQLRDLHNREADLGVPLLISHIREAISSAGGEYDHTLTAPAADVPAGQSELLTFGGCVWGGIRTAAQYQAQLRALLPSGPAWDPERVPELEEVLQGVAVELARLDARAADLLNEMDPAGVSELVPDWERVMNLPDPCLGATPLFDDRRLAVRRRLLAVGSQAVGYYLEIAKSQGYPNATITELEAPRMGRSRFGSAHWGTWEAQFMWTLNTGGRLLLGRRFGASYWGERFGVNPGSALECLIHRSAPAHTKVHINYD